MCICESKCTWLPNWNLPCFEGVELSWFANRIKLYAAFEEDIGVLGPSFAAHCPVRLNFALDAQPSVMFVYSMQVADYHHYDCNYMPY